VQLSLPSLGGVYNRYEPFSCSSGSTGNKMLCCRQECRTNSLMVSVACPDSTYTTTLDMDLDDLTSKIKSFCSSFF